MDGARLPACCTMSTPPLLTAAAAPSHHLLPQELLDCLDLLLAVEKVEDVRAHLGPILARKQAGLLASFTQVIAGAWNRKCC